MKPAHRRQYRRSLLVASRAGAWIETCAPSTISPIASLPARGRGLKQFGAAQVGAAQVGVASRAGAWIETARCRARRPIRARVASRAGAWIETSAIDLTTSLDQSLPARGRGLKPPGRSRHSRGPSRVASRAGAWIETMGSRQICDECIQSLPARGRGLKPPTASNDASWPPVASRAGAWIETRRRANVGLSPLSLPARGRGLKRQLRRRRRSCARSRFPRGGVD